MSNAVADRRVTRGRRVLCRLAVLMAGVCMPHAAVAVTCDFAWAPGWGPTGLGANGIVRCMLTHDPDGAGPLPPRLYVGGDFTTIGGVAANHVAYFDGRQWFPLLGPGGENGTSGTVRALALRDTGVAHIVVGGQFAAAGGVTVNNVAEWDGIFWSGFGTTPGTSGNSGVNALIMFGGKLYAGGSFTAAGGTAANFISRFDFTAGSWSWPGGASNGAGGGVNCFAVFNSKLHVGGAFPTAGASTDARFIATWEDGIGWRGVGGGVSSTVDAMLVHDGKLILGGNFTSTGAFPGAAANRIASWNGTAYAALSTGFTGRVRSLADFDEDGACPGAATLYAGGEFFNAGTTQVNFIARWDGTAWGSLGPAGPSAGSLSVVYAMAQRDDLCGPALYANANEGPSLSIASNIGAWTWKDTDRDGIPDCWESAAGAIDMDCDGMPDLDLFAKGCRPDHKDILVEVDAMGAPIAPTQALLDGVAAKFAAVPNSEVGNPDGTPGYHLVAELDETNLPDESWVGDAWPKFDAVKAAHFGTPANHVAKNRVYRYCVFARQFNADQSSGLAEFRGNDFFVTLGSWTGTTDEQKQGAFMHELGHTLGLTHGGDQNDPAHDERFNYKPNYKSVMNYLWQFRAPLGVRADIDLVSGGYALDYSHAALPTVKEGVANPDGSITDGLVESAGFGGAATVFEWARFPQIGSSPSFVAVVPQGAAIDWNRDGDTADVVVNDVNWVRGATGSPGDTLTGYADWINLQPCFCHNANAVDAQHGDSTPPEMTRAMMIEIGLGGSPACPCVADFDASGGTPDAGDIEAFFAMWLAGDPSADADCSGGTPDAGDIDAFFGQWLAGGCA